MALLEELELPNLDYIDPAMRGERFHAEMRELRKQAAAGGHGWLATGPFGAIVLDRESCEFFLRSRSTVFPGLKIAEIFDVTEGPLYEQMRRNILHVNGPDHSRLRSLVNPALSPRAVQRYRPAMAELLQALYDQVGDAGRCEFVAAFAKPYPSQVIAKVMGAPQQDAPRLHHWSNWIQRQFDAASMAEQRPQIEQAVDEFYRYATGLLHARRLSPGDDLISKLIEATHPDAEGTPSEKLSDVECVNLVFNVLAGGVDTSQSQLAHAIRLFSEHPDQWDLLAENPSLAEQAVEETLRFEPITPFTARIVTEQLTYRDVVFPEGSIVMVCAFTGNRDLPAGSGDPERFDITADRGGARALTFGAGVHYCLGANLARLELTEALNFLAPRMRDLRPDGDPVFEGITGIYGLTELPVRWSEK
jgi:cytochrome P450